MNPEPAYLFKSARLGFRSWLAADLNTMAEMNADPQVMEFFPALQSEQETAEFMQRMQTHFAEKGFCYFAVDLLEDNSFIGFIGLLEKTFATDFTPCTDIGWRIHRNYWHQGYATEGARRCLDYAFDTLGINKIVAMAPAINQRSVQVMKKIGMQKVKSFKHPLLKNDEKLEDCVLYEMQMPG